MSPSDWDAHLVLRECDHPPESCAAKRAGIVHESCTGRDAFAQPGPDRSAPAPAGTASTQRPCRRRTCLRRSSGNDLARDSVCSRLQTAGSDAAPQPKTAEQLVLERNYRARVYSPQSAHRLRRRARPFARSHPRQAASQEPGELAALLRPAVSAAVRAQVLPTQRLLLPKGAFIDCTLETAIDSTLPGMTTCIMATDAFGVDGQVVLLERGTKLIGRPEGRSSRGRREYSFCGRRPNARGRDRAAGVAGCG